MWLDEKKREGGMKKRERRKQNCTNVIPRSQGMTKNRDFTEEQAKFAFSCADVNEDDKIDISEFVQLFFPSAKEVGNSLQNV